jgi:Zn-dependent alcohol dehydrogenase
VRQIWISKRARPRFLLSKRPPILSRLQARCVFASRQAASISPTFSVASACTRIFRVFQSYRDMRLRDASTKLAGVDPSWVGRNVFALTRFGGYADVVCVPRAQVFVRPEGMSAHEGAAIPVNYLTAWQLTIVMGGLKPNETVLIHSAGGGVGIAATQIAKHIGARVIGTASAAKHGELRALGVDHLIDYRTEDFEARARQITVGRGSNSSSTPSAATR